MDCANDPRIETVTFESSIQVGKTEILLNVIGYHIDHDPCPMLAIQPTQKPMAETFSKDRVTPMCRDTPALAGKLHDSNKRDGDNTILRKGFPGGHLTFAGANSPSSLASRPVRITLSDEIDRWAVSAGKEGDPLKLAEKRTTTFWNKQKWRVSSPTLDGQSRIDASFKAGDMRYFYVPCPHKRCKAMQRLVWANVKFDMVGDVPDLDSVHYECEVCGKSINHTALHRMLAAGEWRAVKPFDGHASFHLSALYSPWMTWREVVAEWHDARGDPEAMKVWTNTVLGEVYRQPAKEIKHEALYHKREAYAVPNTIVLTLCTVDVQDDRLELLTVGWAPREIGWHLEHKIIYGDTTLQDVWSDLETYITDTMTRRDDGETVLRIAAVGIDSGHQTKMVYAFCKATNHPRVWALKGVGGERAITEAPVRSSKTPVPVFTVGTDPAKDVLFNRLGVMVSPPDDDPMWRPMFHFSMACTTEYFEQLTAERAVKKVSRGFEFREWQKHRPRNEILDLWVYQLATLYILNPAWDSLAGAPDDESEQPQPEQPSPAEQAQDEYLARVRRQNRQRGGFVRNW